MPATPSPRTGAPLLLIALASPGAALRGLSLLGLLALSAGCLSAATEVVDDSGATGADGGSPTDGGAGGDGGSSGDGGTGADGGSVDPLASDDDGDGWSEDEGDCDDADPGRNPGELDGCDGQDSDCDGEVDEDAASDDGTEPNDPGAWTLGDLAEDPELQALASLHNDDDVDRFRFDLDDSGWSLFTLQVSVSNIPSGSRYRATLTHLDLGIVYLDEAGSGTLSVEVEDTAWQEDSGTWELVVQAESGADCGADYLVTVALD